MLLAAVPEGGWLQSSTELGLITHVIGLDGSGLGLGQVSLRVDWSRVDLDRVGQQKRKDEFFWTIEAA